MHNDDETLCERHIAEVCAQILADLEELAHSAAARRTDLPTYRTGVLSESALEEAGRQSVEYIVHYIRSRSIPSSLQSLAAHLGRSRADIGIPSGELHRALSIDFGVVWAAAAAHASGYGPDVLHEIGLRLWEGVDYYTRRVLASYLSREQELDRANAIRTQAILARLLNEEPLSVAEVTHMCSEIGFNPFEPLDVIIAPLSTEIMTQVATASPKGRVQHFLGPSFQLILHQEGTAPLVDQLLQGSVMDSRVHVRNLQQSCRLLSELYSALGSEHRPTRLRDQWLTLARSRMGELGEYFESTVLGPVLDLPASHQSVLLTTIDAYSVSGTLRGAAERVFSHRNTVKNRLQIVKELTGFDPEVPKDLAVILLAMSAQAVSASDAT
ncbi:helix-turn-helix domain-containing protein [Leucobacter sp. L43]|uniref:PucR family transcriptional regulator n=1 Tax=Leucobacter sp. L43 TaxID=2798040 RepID=UPI001905EBB1|nr:helix-turn-helix domain-containing protein [Leucobacter sp. L43]